MEITVNEAILIRDIRCLKYKAWCCLSATEFDEIIELVGTKGGAYVKRLYDGTCHCSALGGGVAADSACTKEFIEKMCTPTIITTVLVVDEALETAVLFGASKLSPALKSALFAASIATQAWIATCADKTVAEPVLLGICQAISKVAHLAESAPEIVKAVLFPVIELAKLIPVGDFLEKCCSQLCKSNVPPEWVDKPSPMTLAGIAKPDWWQSEMFVGNQIADSVAV